MKNRPPSSIKNARDAEEDDDYNNDFEDDAGGDD